MPERAVDAPRPAGALPAFPADLRIDRAPPHFAAAGARARAWLEAGALHVRVDGHAAVLRFDPAADPVDVAVWPFGAERSLEGGARERLFVAPEHGLIVFERELDRGAASAHESDRAAAVRVTGDADEGLAVAIDGASAPRRFDVAAGAHEGRVRIAIAPAGQSIEVDALLASAVARARRRNARRPRASLPDVAGDPFALAEHAFRLEADSASSPLHAATLVLASLALNDVDAAARAFGSLEATSAAIAEEEAAAALALGAWAAWRGTSPPNEAVRAAGHDWLRRHAGSGAGSGAGLDAWAAAALALAPAAAELLDDPALRERLRSASREEPASALEPARALARLGGQLCAGGPEPAGALLGLVHGTLGIGPDAQRARMRLAPLLRQGESFLERVPLGDAAVTLHCRLEESVADVRVEQVTGSVPASAILEPVLPGRRLTGAAVDGKPAGLDAGRTPDGLQVKVQLVLDAPRVVRLEFEPS